MKHRILFTLLVASSAFAVDKPTLAEREAAHYRIAQIATPEGELFEAGAVCVLGPDKIACSTRTGDIWIAEGVLAEPAKPKWTLFARGLHEVLGLAAKDGAIYATQRCEVTRLRDENGDGRADLVEPLSDDWGINGDYHEYAFGSPFDRDGNLWVALCLTGSFGSSNPYRGWALRITPDGKTIPTCSGLRSPGGIGFNAEGDCFYTDNQGPWNGACKLQWLKPGAFVGHPGGLGWAEKEPTKTAIAAAGFKKHAEPTSGSRLWAEAARIPELLPPAVYFPYNKMGQSAAGFACDLTGGKFGPFAKQLFVGDQTHSTVMRVFLEKVNGRYQGACFPFRSGFGSGALGLAFAADGSLLVHGTDRGWGARGGKPFALERLVFTGKTPFEIVEMRAEKDGFTLRFTEPIDAATANAAAFKMESYTYIYQSSYGSPEVDKQTPKITSAIASADGMELRLTVEGLRVGCVHELHADGLRAASGAPLLHAEAYYTLGALPDGAK